MCGFAGYVGGDLSGQNALQTLERMATTIAHRGPDDSGNWADDSAAVGLAHRRLAVVDLSSAGHQPMISAGGYLVLVFNGEIYNHHDLRRELELQGWRDWRGHSDTETLLAGFEEWGVERTMTRAVGMFAFALWNRKERVLKLGRDRVGEKPLYFGWQEQKAGGRVFLFGSELKALAAHPAFVGEICDLALRDFVRYGNVPGERSIYRGIQKLLPGCLLTLDSKSNSVSTKAYWRLEEAVERGRLARFSGTPREALEQIEQRIAASVRHQILADVPVGAFLSGGIDSSLVVALMCRESTQKVRTFSIGFDQAAYNEAPAAKAIAKHLGTDHEELYVSSKMAAELIPRLATMFDEPFADSSQIPTCFVSKLARSHVTVALSGDGGDEIFGGYNRHLYAAAIWANLARLPVGVRSVLGAVLRSITPMISDRHNVLLPKNLRLAGLAEKMQKGASVLSARNFEDLYQGLLAISSDADSILDAKSTNASGLQPTMRRVAGLSESECMMFWDLLNFLPDDILVKVDRTAMSESLETRIPLLDHRLIEFSWSLPVTMKIHRTDSGYVSKWALRELLAKYVPSELRDGPKRGFAVPVGDWIKGPLRDWAEDLLSMEKLRNTGMLNAELIRKMFQEHQSGKHNWQHKLWIALTLQSWFDGEAKRIASAKPA